jgi:hypothetical protein
MGHTDTSTYMECGGLKYLHRFLFKTKIAIKKKAILSDIAQKVNHFPQLHVAEKVYSRFVPSFVTNTELHEFNVSHKI